MKNRWKRKYIAGLIGVLITAAGIGMVAVQYTNAKFSPDIYNGDRQKKENQVVFPGEDNMLGDDKSDDSELWKQNKNAEENQRPQNRPNSSLLYQTIKVADNQKNTENADQSDSSVGSTEDVVYAPGNKDDKSGTAIPGTTNTKPGDNDSNGGSTDSGNTPGSNTNTPGTTEDEHGPNEPNEPDAPVTPDGPNEPDTPVTPSDPVTPPVPDPPKPADPSDDEDTDQDTTKPSLPADNKDFPAEPYPGDDKVDIEDYDSYSLMVMGILNQNDDSNCLYEGEYLNDERVFCSVIVYVCVDGKEKYRLTELNENFKVGAYPKKVTGDKVELEFYFRPGKEYEWIKATYEEQVMYSAKLLLQNWQTGEYIKQYMVPKNNHKVNLFKYYPDMMHISSDPFGFDEADQLFAGWSTEKNGKSVPPIYTVEETGAQILYPVALSDIDEEYTVEWQNTGLTLNNLYYYNKFQTLTGYTGQADVLRIPEGVSVVNLPVDVDYTTFDEIFQTFSRVEVPQSVMALEANYWGDIGGTSFNVTDAYAVDEGNAVFSAYDDMLLNKSQTIIYDIPDSKSSVHIPETVNQVTFLQDNVIKELHFAAEKPITIDFSNIRDAKIYVPNESYVKYLSAWGRHPGDDSNTLMPEEGEPEEIAEDENGIYSADGKVLQFVKSSVHGVYVVPEGIETIREDAFDNCGSLELLILPTTLKKLEAGCLAGNAPAKIVFLGKEAPTVAATTFGDASVLQVLQSAKSAYEQKWRSVLGDRMDAIVYKNYTYEASGTGGFSYLQEDAYGEDPAGAILIKAPKELTKFNEASAQGIVWKEIAANAFSSCTALVVAELPASIKTIGKEAFAGCGSLQGVLSNATDQIRILDQAFADTPALRYMAWNADYIESYSYTGNAMCFAPCDGSGYSKPYRFSPSYYLKESNKATFLYGIGTDDENRPTDGRYLLGVTDQVTGKVQLEKETVLITARTFRNCSNSFSISGMEQLELIDVNAFENSALQGEVKLGSDLTYLGDSAFSGCKEITKVTIDGSGLQNGVVYRDTFGNYVFQNCEELTEVSFTGTGSYELGSLTFYGCKKLSSITFGEQVGITAIQQGAFGETAISEIVLPKRVGTLEYGIFAECANLHKAIFQSDEAPQLRGYVLGFAYNFGDDSGLTDGSFVVPSGREQAYVDSWKYYMLGWSPDDAGILSEDEVLESENRVRAMLGMAPVESEPEEEDPEAAQTPDSGETADGQEPAAGNTEEQEPSAETTETPATEADTTQEPSTEATTEAATEGPDPETAPQEKDPAIEQIEENAAEQEKNP